MAPSNLGLAEGAPSSRSGRRAAEVPLDPELLDEHAKREPIAAVEVLRLYRQLQRAQDGSEEFELLSAAFNRVCSANPEAVEIALRMEAYTA